MTPPNKPPGLEFDVKAFLEYLYAHDWGLEDDCAAAAHDGARWQFEQSQAQIVELKAEIDEQCRVNGMGAQRELKLMTEVAALKAELDARAEIEKTAARELILKARQKLIDGGTKPQDFQLIDSLIDQLEMIDSFEKLKLEFESKQYALDGQVRDLNLEKLALLSANKVMREALEYAESQLIHAGYTTNAAPVVRKASTEADEILKLAGVEG